MQGRATLHSPPTPSIAGRLIYGYSFGEKKEGRCARLAAHAGGGKVSLRSTAQVGDSFSRVTLNRTALRKVRWSALSAKLAVRDEPATISKGSIMFWFKHLTGIALVVGALMLFGNFANNLSTDVHKIEHGLGSAFSVSTYLK